MVSSSSDGMEFIAASILYWLAFTFLGQRLFLVSIYHGIHHLSIAPYLFFHVLNHFLIVLYLSSIGFYLLMVGFHQLLSSSILTSKYSTTCSIFVLSRYNYTV
jgi:hypothetical protein